MATRNSLSHKLLLLIRVPFVSGTYIGHIGRKKPFSLPDTFSIPTGPGGPRPRGRPFRLERARRSWVSRQPGKTQSAPGLGPSPAHGQCQPQRALRAVSHCRLEVHSQPRCHAGFPGQTGRKGPCVRLSASGSPRPRSYRLHGSRGAHVGNLPGVLPGLPLPRGKHAISRSGPDPLALLHRLDIALISGHARRRSAGPSDSASGPAT